MEDKKRPHPTTYLSFFSGALWLVGILGSPLLMLYAMYHYPLQDDNDPALWRILPGGYALSFVALCFINRKQLATRPRRGASPGTVYFLLMLMAVLPVMALLGLFFLLNGALDKSPPRATLYAVRDAAQGFISGSKGARIPAMLFSLEPSDPAGTFRAGIGLHSYRPDADISN